MEYKLTYKSHSLLRITKNNPDFYLFITNRKKEVKRFTAEQVANGFYKKVTTITFKWLNYNFELLIRK